MRLCIIDTKTRFTKASHHLSGVCPQGGTEAILVLPVIVPAEDGIPGPRFRQWLRDVGIVVKGDFPVFHDDFAKVSVNRHVIELRRDTGKEKGISVVIAEYDIDRSKEAFGELGEGKRCAEVTQEQQPADDFGFDTAERFLQIPYVVMNVADYGDRHRFHLPAPAGSVTMTKNLRI